MKTRITVRIISYLGIAAVTLGALCTLEKRRADTAERELRYRGEQAFGKTGKRQITHGGSHLLEVAIPFITIQ